MRWQVQEGAPFPIEQAVVSYTPGARLADGGQEFVVTVARARRRGAVRAGVRDGRRPCGLVDLATFSVINACSPGPSAPSGDWLLVHAAASYVTLAVLREAM